MRCQRRRALSSAPLCAPSNAPLFPAAFLSSAGRSDAESRAVGPLTLVRRTAWLLPSCTVVALGAVGARAQPCLRRTAVFSGAVSFEASGACVVCRAAVARGSGAANRRAVWSRAAGCAVLLWAKGARPVRGERLVR